MIERMLQDIIQIVNDKIAVFQLRRMIIIARLRHYDLLVENVRGLKHALNTHKRTAEDLRKQLKSRDEQIKELRKEYAALEKRKAGEGVASTQSEQMRMFKQLQPVITQLPTVRAALDNGSDISARDVVDLLAPLDELLADSGFEMIGAAGDETSFDPTLHKAVGKGARSVETDEAVRVRYVGYRYQGDIMAKAQVTRIES